MKKFFVLLTMLLSVNTFSGELIFSYDYIKSGCTVDYKGLNACTVLAILMCNGKEVVARSGPRCISASVPVADIQRTDPSYTVARFSEGFYIDAAGFHNILGVVSVSSSNNVFQGRPLSQNYKPYSLDGILDKPVIIVEGYDVSNEMSPSDLYQKAFSGLMYGGRDVFVVNLNSKDKSINDNAVLLQKIIQEINGAKRGSHPTAVIGYSMGGIVARKALKNMELAGINHQASLYVSYDSPHMGANLQGSIPRTVDRLIDKIDDRSFGYTPSALSRARNMYMSPSAQEMLIGGLKYAPAKSSDFPIKPVRVAVTSGQLQGVLQEPSILDGEQVGYFNMTVSTTLLGQTITLSETSTLYGSKRAGVFYDNVPGSYLYQFDDFMDKLSEGVDISIRQDHRVPYSRKITFIPTLSSLAIARAPTMPAYDLFKFYSPFDKYIAVDTTGRDARTVFNAQDSLGSNQRHDIFYSSQLNQLKLALDDYHKIGFVVPDRSFKSN